MDDSSQLTQLWLGLGEGSELSKEEVAVERVKELSISASQEEDKEKEDEKLDLVLGELVKIINDSEDEIH